MSRSERFFCNECGKEQRHQIAAKHDNTSSDAGGKITRTAEILECGGCGYTLLRRKTHFSEFEDHPGDFNPEPQYVPPLNRRQEPVWLATLDDNNMKAVIFETFRAFNQEMRYLAAVGVRTVLDMVLVSKIGDIGGFKRKLKRLEEDGHVTSSERQQLDVLAEVGDAAAHRGHKLNIEDLNVIMIILEQIVHKLYVQPKQDKYLADHANRIGTNVPPRPKSKA